MNRPRNKAEGLPFYVYERHGVTTYSIGYKRENKWVFKYRCPIGDLAKINQLRRDACKQAIDLNTQAGSLVEGTFGQLADDWLAWQEKLPLGSSMRRAESTLAENKRELVNLKRAFGTMLCHQIEKGDAYAYLDACLIAKDKLGNLRPRPEKGNKEISLARGIFEWGLKRRGLKVNPFDGVEKLITEKTDRLVTPIEMELATEVGRRMGGPQHICALGLRTAWLCLKRSVEVRALTRDQIGDDGITWKAAKRHRGKAETVGLIEWSDDLRATVNEALGIKRNKLAGSWYVFGNLSGQRYTKGGWKATLAKLMDECEAEAARRHIAFLPFSLQDCRPKGVTDKLARGDTDTQDATLHSNKRMLEQIYDRRRIRVAKPAG